MIAALLEELLLQGVAKLRPHPSVALCPFSRFAAAPVVWLWLWRVLGLGSRVEDLALLHTLRQRLLLLLLLLRAPENPSICLPLLMGSVTPPGACLCPTVLFLMSAALGSWYCAWYAVDSL